MEKTYPKGTTKEQWDVYELQMKEHNRRMELKKIHFDQAIFCIRGILTESQLDVARDLLKAEVLMSDSCDAPNKPGYYRANND